MRTQRQKLLALRQGNRQGRAAALAARLSTDADFVVRAEALETLLETGTARYLAIAVARLGDVEGVVIATAIQCIVEWEGKRLAPRIARLLDSPSDLVRFYAAWAIGRLDGLRWAPVLKRRFRRARGHREAVTIAESLYRLTRRRSYLTYLLGSVSSSDSETRASATNSLSGIVTKQNFAEIIGALSTERNQVVQENLCRDLTLAVEAAVDLTRMRGQPERR